MKRCKQCNIEKELDSFYQYKHHTNGKLYFHSWCKECYTIKSRNRAKKWIIENSEKNKNRGLNYYYNVYKDGKWEVYCLPNANYYVGQTCTLKKRMNEHMRNGNDSTDYIILHECDTEK